MSAKKRGRARYNVRKNTREKQARGEAKRENPINRL